MGTTKIWSQWLKVMACWESEPCWEREWDGWRWSWSFINIHAWPNMTLGDLQSLQSNLDNCVGDGWGMWTLRKCKSWRKNWANCWISLLLNLREFSSVVLNAHCHWCWFYPHWKCLKGKHKVLGIHENHVQCLHIWDIPLFSICAIEGGLVWWSYYRHNLRDQL